MEAEKELETQGAVDAKTHNELGKVKNEKAIYVGGNGFIFNRMQHNIA